MGFLNPLFLIASTVVAVPILLHLLHRQRARRLIFPALRYLRRTEKEHARRIRIRQLILLLLRCAAVLLLVASGARLFLKGPSQAHDPTALAIILDNSMSSGRVTGETRVLDGLKALASESLDLATGEDLIWVIRAAEPWDVSVPGGVGASRYRVEETRLTAARGDLATALTRARALLEATELEHREIHLLSDLQATALIGVSADLAGDIPVVVWHSSEEPPPNRFLMDVLVGGGLPPLANQRTDIAVTLGGSADTAAVPLRLILNGRIRAASSGRAGETVVLAAGPFQQGNVAGWVETDPDELSWDDRLYLTFEVRPSLRVAVEGPPGLFLSQALDVLAESGRIQVGAEPAEVVIAASGVEVGRAGAASIVIPPDDETLLPALNRRLAAAGIPWVYQAPVGVGQTRVTENRLPVRLDEVRITQHYRITPTAGEPPTADIPVRLSDGDPYFVSGRPEGLAYLLLATPLDPSWSTLPIEAEMIPLLEWMVSRWARGGGGADARVAGDPLPLPISATAVDRPDGSRHAVEGARLFRETAESGLYRIMSEDQLVGQVAVNPPIEESDLTPVSRRDVEQLLGADVHRVDEAEDWSRSVFRARQGAEPWKPLLVIILLILMLESWFAAAGPGTKPGRAKAEVLAPKSDGTGGTVPTREERVGVASGLRN